MSRGKTFFSHSNRELISSNITTSFDVIIVGAGVAGSALAHALAKDGRKVHVIERNLNEPSTISGELLQPAGYLKLLELGLDDCVRDIDAQKVVGYAIHNHGKSTTLPFPLENYDADVAARTFHHGRFVQKLREKAASLPNVKMEQGTVTSLIEEKGTIKGVRYKTRNGQESTTYASLTVVCDGCFSSLRKFLAHPKTEKHSYAAGFIMENCLITHPNYAHLVLGDPVSAIFYRISRNEVRFFADIPGPKVPSVSNGQMSHYLKTVVAPQVPSEMYNAFISSLDKGTSIRIMPINSMPAAPYLVPGAILLGDALNMRHVITGGGMTAALNDVSFLCNILKHLNLDDTSAVTKKTEYFYKYRKPKAFTINVIVDALYKIVCASPEENRMEFQQALFNYLCLGQHFSAGVVGLISGLNPQPRKLVLYFFVIIVYMVGFILFPFPTPKRIYAASRLVLVVAAIVFPIIMKNAMKQVSSMKKMIIKAFQM